MSPDQPPAASPPTPAARLPTLSTGIPGLDRVLAGGLTRGRFYLVEGMPGAGKTTLALQFLIEGARRGERVLYVTLSETGEELRAVARSHDWSLDGIDVLEVLPSEEVLRQDSQYTVFHPTEIELAQTTGRVIEAVERVLPDRLVLDSLSELRLLSGSPLRYRRQVLALKQFLTVRGTTVLVLDDRSGTLEDPQVHSIAHGIVLLEHVHPEYGRQRRRLRVEKYRGVAYLSGNHDYRIRRGGLAVSPQLVPEPSSPAATVGELSTGNAGLDEMLGGGLRRGTSTLLSGAPGTGKSSLAVQVALAAARRGERAAVYLFDERTATLRVRAAGLGMDPEPLLASGRLRVHEVDPADCSPGEFGAAVAEEAVGRDLSCVVIDSLNGYMNAMQDTRSLQLQLHELLACLARRGIVTVLVSVQQGFIGTSMVSPFDASYLADNVIVLRYFELEGEVRQAISVLKNRAGNHERTIRDYRLTPGGIRLGPPLHEFRGVLTGVPTFVGGSTQLAARDG